MAKSRRDKEKRRERHQRNAVVKTPERIQRKPERRGAQTSAPAAVSGDGYVRERRVDANLFNHAYQSYTPEKGVQREKPKSMMRVGVQVPLNGGIKPVAFTPSPVNKEALGRDKNKSIQKKRDEPVKQSLLARELKNVCKKRPDRLEPRRAGGGAAKRFVPWCK